MVDYPSEEQGIEKKKFEAVSEEEEDELEMELGDKDEEVYEEEGREQLLEDDEIQPHEEGFMKGASGKGQTGKCTNCDAVLSQDMKEIVEQEIDGEERVFCSAACRDEYKEK